MKALVAVLFMLVATQASASAEGDALRQAVIEGTNAGATFVQGQK